MTVLDNRWRKATDSGDQGACVMVRFADGLVEVRDSKAGNDAPVQRYTPAEWTAFQSGVRGEEFELPA